MSAFVAGDRVVANPVMFGIPHGGVVTQAAAGHHPLIRTDKVGHIASDLIAFDKGVLIQLLQHPFRVDDDACRIARIALKTIGEVGARVDGLPPDRLIALRHLTAREREPEALYAVVRVEGLRGLAALFIAVSLYFGIVLLGGR